MPSARALPAALALAAALHLLAACGGDDTDQGAETAATEAETTTLTTSSGRDEERVGPIIDRFEQQTGIQTEVRYGDTAELAGTIIEEGERSPADVFFGQDAGALGALQKDGRLATLPEEILERVPPEFRSDRDQWVGTSGRVRIAAYDERELDEADLPDSILDLTDPEWGGGRIGWAPTNGSFQAFVTALRVTEGDDAARDWLEGIVANDPVTYDGNVPIRDAIEAGEIDVGLINHYYVARAIDETSEDFQASEEEYPVGAYFFGDGDIGSLVNIAGGGVVTTTDDEEAALGFLEFLLSEAGQEYFREETNEYALIEGVADPDGQPPLEEIEHPDIDLSDLDDLEGTVATLKEQGVTVTLEPKTLTADGHYYKIAFIEDPDGYKIELVESGTMKVGNLIQ
jgi:iron(III) transport system substrate-binding protein